MNELSHYDEAGKIKMVDVSGKETTARRAVATAKVLLNEATLKVLLDGANPKVCSSKFIFPAKLLSPASRRRAIFPLV